MRSLFTIMVLGVMGFFAYQRLLVPTEITDPVYAEIRIVMEISGRKIQAALFGKAADEADCQERAERLRMHLQDKCDYCVSSSIECKADLDARYLAFFDNKPATAPYLSIDRSRRGEIDGRLIFWGLTRAEGDFVCEKMQQIMAEIHDGPMQCVPAIGA